MGLDELFDDDIRDGKKSYAEEIVRAGIASRADVFSLVGEYLGCEVQVGSVDEVEAEVLALVKSDIANQYAVFPFVPVRRRTAPLGR